MSMSIAESMFNYIIKGPLISNCCCSMHLVFRENSSFQYYKLVLLLPFIFFEKNDCSHCHKYAECG